MTENNDQVSTRWLLKPIKGKKPVISWEDVCELQIDHAYQRAIDSPASRKMIKEIACNWNWDICNVLTIVDRGEKGLYVVDGQHRLEAARLRGDVPLLPCIAMKCESREAEARLFVDINTARRGTTRLDKFHALCLMGDAEACAIQSLVSDAGLFIGKSPRPTKPGELCCITTLTRLYRQYDKSILSAALVTAAEAFRSEPLQTANELLPGLCLLFHGTDIDDPEANPDVLRARTQIGWYASAKTAQTENDGPWPDEVFRDVIRDAYLKHLKAQAALGKIKIKAQGNINA